MALTSFNPIVSIDTANPAKFDRYSGLLSEAFAPHPVHVVSPTLLARQQPGFGSTTLHQALAPDADFRFVNVARWESAEAFRAAVAQTGFKEAGEDAVSQLAGAVSRGAALTASDWVNVFVGVGMLAAAIAAGGQVLVQLVILPVMRGLPAHLSLQTHQATVDRLPDRYPPLCTVTSL